MGTARNKDKKNRKHEAGNVLNRGLVKGRQLRDMRRSQVMFSNRLNTSVNRAKGKTDLTAR